MKKIGLISSAFLLLLFFLPSAMVQAQTSNPSMTCIPVQQFALNKTQIECRMRTAEVPYFLVAEVTFPFKVTNLIKVSSIYSATMGSVYPSQLVENTIVIASTDWGNKTDEADLQEIPFDSLSFLLETDQSLSQVKKAFSAKKTEISLLSPNPTDPANPFFQTLTPDHSLLFDGSLVLESFTQYVSPGVLQFLRLGLACYEKSPQACLTNIIQNL